jgi:hypothetical protein
MADFFTRLAMRSIGSGLAGGSLPMASAPSNGFDTLAGMTEAGGGDIVAPIDLATDPTAAPSPSNLTPRSPEPEVDISLPHDEAAPLSPRSRDIPVHEASSVDEEPAPGRHEDRVRADIPARADDLPAARIVPLGDMSETQTIEPARARMYDAPVEPAPFAEPSTQAPISHEAMPPAPSRFDPAPIRPAAAIDAAAIDAGAIDAGAQAEPASLDDATRMEDAAPRPSAMQTARDEESLEMIDPPRAEPRASVRPAATFEPGMNNEVVEESSRVARGENGAAPRDDARETFASSVTRRTPQPDLSTEPSSTGSFFRKLFGDRGRSARRRDEKPREFTSDDRDGRSPGTGLTSASQGSEARSASLPTIGGVHPASPDHPAIHEPMHLDAEPARNDPGMRSSSIDAGERGGAIPPAERAIAVDDARQRDSRAASRADATRVSHPASERAEGRRKIAEEMNRSRVNPVPSIEAPPLEGASHKASADTGTRHAHAAPRSNATPDASARPLPASKSRGDSSSAQAAPTPARVGDRSRVSEQPRSNAAPERTAGPPSREMRSQTKGNDLRPAKGQRGEPAADAAQGREKGGSAPTIRISIGRVEVRAEAPPSQPPPRQVQQPRGPALSLSEYLKQRNRGYR